jgi:tetratricopeptide (TPR) repeat protein
LAAAGQGEGEKIAREQWLEIRTAHFHVYGCATAQEVYRVAENLEQFHDAGAVLTGGGSVKSPPIVVMVFPDHESLKPFLPLYAGKPANLAGFFKRSSDENLIVLELQGTNAGSMSTIFHEYAHFLFRNSDAVWPLWLKEGISELYSTFEATGRGVRIGRPIAHHLRLLEQTPLMPLKELLAVSHDSPDYNESDRQGVFYAESWLLTHFLMNGDNPLLKARFRDYTKLLREGQPADAAFPRAMGMPLTAMQAELRRYLARGQFEPIMGVVPLNLSVPRAAAARRLGPAEANYRLGNELLRIDRLDDAEPFFHEAEKLAPGSPLSREGLGMLAAARKQTAEALTQLREALRLGSTNFLAHYLYAEERYRQLGDDQGRHSRLAPAPAAEIRAELRQSIALMPDFGPAHELLGFVEMVQGEDLGGAEEQMQQAVRLEPDNRWYLLSLAEAQVASQEPEAARHSLELIYTGRADAKLRAAAAEVLSEINRSNPPQ